jgi:hypothetical protein
MNCFSLIQTTSLFLGQSTDSSRSVLRLMLALAVFLAVAGILLGLLSIYRRRLASGDSSGQPFTLDQLRQLHREGKLTNDEFERAKLNLVGSMHASILKENKPSRNEQALGAEVKEE